MSSQEGSRPTSLMAGCCGDTDYQCLCVDMKKDGAGTGRTGAAPVGGVSGGGELHIHGPVSGSRVYL